HRFLLFEPRSARKMAASSGARRRRDPALDALPVDDGDPLARSFLRHGADLVLRFHAQRGTGGSPFVPTDDRAVQALADRNDDALLALRVALERGIGPDRELVEVELQVAVRGELPDVVAVLLVEVDRALHDLAGRPDDEIVGTRGVAGLAAETLDLADVVAQRDAAFARLVLERELPAPGLVVGADRDLIVVRPAPLADRAEAQAEPPVVLELTRHEIQKLGHAGDVLGIEVDAQIDGERLRPIAQRPQVLEDGRERAAAVAPRPVPVVILRRSVEGDLERADLPGQELLRDLRRQQVAVGRHLAREVDRMLFGRLDEVRAEVFDRFPAVERLAAEPADRQELDRVQPLLDELLDPLANPRLHRAAGEVLVAVLAAEVAVLGGHQDELEDVVAVVLPAEFEADAAELVGSLLEEEAPLEEIQDGPLAASENPATAQDPFDRGTLGRLEDRQRPAEGVPDDQAPVGGHGADV